MKIAKYLLFLVLILIIAGSIYVATKDGDFEVQTSKTIDAPVRLLYEEVTDFSNWEDWTAWTGQEGMQLQLSEETAGEGTEISWQADQLRDGKIVTVSAVPYKSITQELTLDTSVGEADGTITWTFEPSSDGETLVTWTLEGSQDFKEKLAFTLQDTDLTEIFQPIFEQSLTNLEENVIRKMEVYSIDVTGVTEHGGGYYMYKTTAARLGEVNRRAAEMIDEVTTFMNENNISVSGKPFVIYNQRDERNGTTIFSAAVPTPSQVVPPAGSQVLNGYLEPQVAVKTVLKGNHKNAPEAWERTYRYIEENELQVNPQGQPFEIYITDPAEVENPALWVTEIYIPVVEPE